MRQVQDITLLLPESIIQTDCKDILEVCGSLSKSYSKKEKTEAVFYENSKPLNSRNKRYGAIELKAKYIVGVLN